MAPLNIVPHCKLMHMMGPPRDAYVYHYSFNRSHLVDVCSTYVCYLQPNRGCNTSYQKPRLDETFPASTRSRIYT